MAEGIPLPTQRRPGWKPDITSGLGYRPEKHEFDVNDYNAYTTTRDLRLLHTPRGHVALQHGGIAAWLARSAVADEDAINAFRRSFQDIYDAGNCLWDGSSPFAYWYHELSEHEMDLLCGVYHVATGITLDEQTACISWWPRPNSWARGNLDGAWWMPECEAFYQKRLSHLAGNVFLPTSPSKWRHNLKFRKEQKQAKEIWEQFEHVAASIVQRMIEMGLLQDV
ncbi:hypothetical protein C8R44DRAFT_638930 [Mycena epipterygia]|nr:hypothetical protein C8R44DRAFT_638930 [Mycena epipterygia]